MAKQHTYHYHCPIRGAFDSLRIEEEYVIECLHWLLERKRVPKKFIAVEQRLRRFGAGGKNHIRPDILVFSCPAEEAKGPDGEFLTDKVALVVEVKVDSKDKESAVKHQLFPVMDMCKNIVGGLYWDSALRIYLDKAKKEHAAVQLPDDFFLGKSGKIVLRPKSLMPLKRGEKIWDVLDNALRTNQGASKGQMYEELFKILVSKYFDEVNNVPLKFGTFGDDADKVFDRINALYREANKTYHLHEFAVVQTQQIKLNKKSLFACVRALESYSLRKTDRAIIQEFYMKFAPEFLREDLKQYYTPKEIVSFMTENLAIEKKTRAIDPCCGTGDFMVGILRRAHREGIGGEVEKNLFCWDLNDMAVKLAKINMILNGDGRTNVRTIDSLQEFDEDNGRYDYVVTNPPFGQDSLHEGDSISKYALGKKGIRETGKLFVERALHLLDEGGLLVTIAPTGFMNNPRDEAFRKIIFSQSRLVGCILLPAGTFKSAGTGVATDVVILQKTARPPSDYKIFMAVAEKVGFDVSKKNTPALIKRREEDGVFLLDRNNEQEIDNDLPAISERLRSFAADEKLSCFESPEQWTEYDSATFREIRANRHVVNPKLYDRKIGYAAASAEIRKGDHFQLVRAAGASVSNSDRVKPVAGQHYRYIETGDVYRGMLKGAEQMRGWALPGRAKQFVKEHDILVAKMEGSENNFLYVQDEWSGFIASNGFYRVRMEDERKRLSFFRFLFSDAYRRQARALATGSIMGDIKLEDFCSRLYVPILDEYKISQMRKYLDYQREFISISIS